MDKNKTSTILEKLNIKTVTRDMTHNDPKVQVRAILQAWKPLSSTILLQCLKQIPSPCKINNTKIEYLLNVNRFCETQYYNKCIEQVIPYFENISSKPDTPAIAYVSKMFCVSTKNLSQFKPKPFVPKPRNTEPKPDIESKPEVSTSNTNPKESETVKEAPSTVSDDIAVIALARVFSGTLQVGQEIYALTGSYLPEEINIRDNPDEFIKNNPHVNKVSIKELYMLFGRELTLVESVPAGNFCGIGGLESCVIRTATLSTNLNVIPLVEHQRVYPVVRHAIEPANPRELPILHQGLKLLLQSDSCVEVIRQETGELVLLTAGDVHLGKCIEDLKNKFAKIEVHVSSPMVSLRETVVNNQTDYDFFKDNSNTVNLETSHLSLSVIAVPLPEQILEVVKNNHDLLQMVEQHQHKSFIDIAKQSFSNNSGYKIVEKTFKREATKKGLIHVKEQLQTAFKSSAACWKELFNKLWSVGVSSDCVNILINGTSNYEHNIFVELNGGDKRALFDHCIVKAFNILCKAGPLCEEPISNCAFVVKKFELSSSVSAEDITSQTTPFIEANVRDTFKKAFEKQEQRLMEPLYVTEIQVNTNILGKVYKVVSKRHGKILEDVCMDDQEKVFLVKAQIPVLESENFASEMRKTTSGQAIPTLRFSHYEIIDGDPFYEPVEDDDEDEEEDTINVESSIRANKLRKDIRRRKGLHVEDEVVVHAEKQRTLNKKK